MSKISKLTISEHSLDDHDIMISYKEAGCPELFLVSLKFQRHPFYDIKDFDGLVKNLAHGFGKKIIEHRSSVLEKPQAEPGKFTKWRAERATKKILKKLGMKPL